MPRSHRLQLLRHARLYVLIDGAPDDQTFVDQVRLLVQAGVDAIQLRDKHMSDRQLLHRARLLVRHSRLSTTLVVINDRPDIARLAGADGVHLGQDDLPVDPARRLLTGGQLIGVSTHSFEQARAAEAAGADYIGVGPTFPSSTKTFENFPGIPLLHAVRAAIQVPAFAIGGINVQRLPQVLAAGFQRIAVSQAVVAAAQPQEVIATLKHMLAEASAPPHNKPVDHRDDDKTSDHGAEL